MLTNDIRSQIDQIWNAFWSGGISNPLEVIEQITYLLFIKRLDELQTLEELKATRLRQARRLSCLSSNLIRSRQKLQRHT
jgi:type I restriction enzyme M protein